MTATCDRFDLAAFVDGEIDASEILVHLRGCEACSAEVAALRALRDEIAALPCPPIPDDFNARMLAAMEAAPRHDWWTRLVDRIVDLLLGSTRAPSLASLALGTVAMAACLGGTGYVLIHCVVAWTLVPVMERSLWEMWRAWPQWGPIPQGEWSLGITSLLLTLAAVFGLRISGLRALLAERDGDAAAAARTLAAVTVMGVCIGAPAVFCLEFYPARSVFTGYSIHMASGLLIAWCIYAWTVMARRRRGDLVFSAATFYVALFTAYGGVRLFQAAWMAGMSAMQTLYDVDAAAIAILSRQGVVTTLAMLPSCGLALGLLLSAAACGTMSSRFRWMLGMLAVGVVLFGVVPGTAGVREIADLTSAENEPFPVSPDAATQRTALTIGSARHDVMAYDTMGELSPRNVRDLRDFAAAHADEPRGVEALRLLGMEAMLRWDADAMKSWTLAAVTSRAAPTMNWYIYLNRLQGAAPTAEDLHDLETFADLPGLVVTQPDTRAYALARAFDALDDAKGTARWAAQCNEPVPRLPRHHGVAMRDGVVEGTLSLGGRPLGNTRVRLIGRRGSDSYNPSAPEALVFQDALARLRLESTISGPLAHRAWATFQPMTATVTDARGHFRFSGLPDDRYVLAVLFDGPPEGIKLGNPRLPHELAVDGTHPRVDLGVLELGR